MRYLSLLVLGLFGYLLLVVAGRTSNAHISPMVYNTEPDAIDFSRAQTKLRRGRDGHAYAQLLRNSLLGRPLSKRSGVVTYDANCDKAPPANSGYKPGNGFPTMKSVLEKAYQDALTLANTAANMEENN